MSTVPPTLEATDRCPSTSTSVRPTPSPRRPMELMPAPALERPPEDVPEVPLPAIAGIWFTKSEMLAGDCAAMSASPRTATGVGAL